MSDNPWTNLGLPTDPGSVTARRVDAKLRWHFFWARDTEGRALLLLRHSPESTPRGNLPKLKGVEVLVDMPVAGGTPSLALRLLDAQLRDIFMQLCNDIMACTAAATSEAEAVAMAVNRTWRWHHLLRGGKGDLLSPEEQKGLLGELLVLERYFMPALGPVVALEAWHGPLGAAQDFKLGTLAVESKAGANRQPDRILVSSEFQLDDTDCDLLLLHLSSFRPAGAGADDDFTITQVATRLRDRFGESAGASAGRFEALLAAVGFRFEDDYSHWRWVGGERSVYRVTGSFPRITSSTIANGISGVRYQLTLFGCGEYIVPPSYLDMAIRGDNENV